MHVGDELVRRQVALLARLQHDVLAEGGHGLVDVGPSVLDVRLDVRRPDAGEHEDQQVGQHDEQQEGAEQLEREVAHALVLLLEVRRLALQRARSQHPRDDAGHAREDHQPALPAQACQKMRVHRRKSRPAGCGTHRGNDQVEDALARVLLRRHEAAGERHDGDPQREDQPRDELLELAGEVEPSAQALGHAEEGEGGGHSQAGKADRRGLHVAHEPGAGLVAVAGLVHHRVHAKVVVQAERVGVKAQREADEEARDGDRHADEDAPDVDVDLLDVLLDRQVLADLHVVEREAHGDGAGDEEVEDHPVEDPAVDHLHRAQAEAQAKGQQRDVARRRGDRRPGRRVRLRQLGKLNRL